VSPPRKKVTTREKRRLSPWRKATRMLMGGYLQRGERRLWLVNDKQAHRGFAHFAGV
jgi:hypothetical protein